MLIRILQIFTIIIGVMWINGIIYLCSGGRVWIFNRFYHNVMGWHLPDQNEPEEFDGVNIHTHCKFCGKEITQDSQGNWY